MAYPDDIEQGTVSATDTRQSSTTGSSSGGMGTTQRTARALVDDLQSILRDTDDIGLRDAIESCLGRTRAELDAGGLADEAGARLGEAGQRMRQAATRVTEGARQGYERARETMADTVRRSRDTVAERPMTGVGVALVAGMIIGLSLTRRR